MLNRNGSVLLVFALLMSFVVSCAAPAAPAAPAATAQPAAPEPTKIPHTIIPGNPGAPKQEMNDIDTSKTASDRTAAGDSFRLGIFERPFSKAGMNYQQETDLLSMELTEDENFFYFSIRLAGAASDGTLSASYGIEIDTDLDSRGDFLLWVKGMNYTEWTIDDVMLFQDSNDDVGGVSPSIADSKSGSGYDQVLFSKDLLTDPDVAWQRVSPNNRNIIQLAVKKSVVNSSKFMWKGWADGGLADPTKFDYNDTMSEKNAGSPKKNTEFYPINFLFLMDSTCWTAYGFNPTGFEPGGCYIAPKPVTCHCSNSRYTYKEICIKYGASWICE